MTAEEKKLIRGLIEAINELNQTLIAKQFYPPQQIGGGAGMYRIPYIPAPNWGGSGNGDGV